MTVPAKGGRKKELSFTEKWFRGIGRQEEKRRADFLSTTKKNKGKHD